MSGANVCVFVPNVDEASRIYTRGYDAGVQHAIDHLLAKSRRWLEIAEEAGSSGDFASKLRRELIADHLSVTAEELRPPPPIKALRDE